ncbi:MAG: SRPBCC family protein [Acidimicrobiia bacterium]|nr:SRPBCC family protein [Acidimicrobiia bacterium]
MARITVSIEIEAPLERVWGEAADLAAHVEWMADARSIEFLTDQRSGVGTRMLVETKVGPLQTNDVMEVTGWDEQHSIDVRHQGIITGQGSFRLEASRTGTRFTWTEQLAFPWYLGGPVTALAARPILRWIWRRNLEGLRRRIETPTDPN